MKTASDPYRTALLITTSISYSRYFSTAMPIATHRHKNARLEARMTPRALRWATGGVAALSVALLLGGLPLAYLGRHVATAGLWNFPDVFEELTFVAVPVVGFVLASRRPANKIGWIILAVGLLL